MRTEPTLDGMGEEQKGWCVASGGLEGLPAEVAMARLPAGRHGLSPSFVSQNQRLRLLAAMLRVLPKHGYPQLTIGHLTREAGVSRGTFYKQFSDKEECFLATYDVASGWVCERVEAAVEGIDDWEQRVRAGASEALSLFGSTPLVAHLMAIEVPRVGLMAREREVAMLDRFAAALLDGAPRRPGVSSEMARLQLGGVAGLISHYIVTGRAEQLPEAADTLVAYLLMPYLDDED